MSETLANADVAGLMASWLPRQRWFAGEHGGVTLASAGHVRLEDPYPAAAGHPVDIVVHFVRSTPAGGSDETATTYQVPLTYRTEESLRALADGLDPAALSIGFDETRCQMFLRLEKPA